MRDELPVINISIALENSRGVIRSDRVVSSNVKINMRVGLYGYYYSDRIEEYATVSATLQKGTSEIYFDIPSGTLDYWYKSTPYAYSYSPVSASQYIYNINMPTWVKLSLVKTYSTNWYINAKLSEKIDKDIKVNANMYDIDSFHELNITAGNTTSNKDVCSYSVEAHNVAVDLMQPTAGNYLVYWT